MSSHEQGALSFPAVRRWPQRSSSTPWVPGSPDQIIDNLRGLLAEIKSDGTPDRSFAWPANGVSTTIRAAVHNLGSCGLVNKKGDHLELTDDAEIFLSDGGVEYLIATFHSNVRFVGELLAELEVPKTHSELNSAASDKYLLDGLHWIQSGDGPIGFAPQDWPSYGSSKTSLYSPMRGADSALGFSW